MSDSSVEKQQPEVYIVEKILEKRFKSGKPEYRVKWQGFSASDSTWEGIAKLKKYAQLVDDFECRKRSESGSSEGKPRKAQSSGSSSSEKNQKKSKLPEKKTKISNRQLSSSSSSSVQRSKPKRGRPQQKKKQPSPSDSEKEDKRRRNQKSSSSEPTKKAKPNKKVASSSDEEQVNKKVSNKKKEIRISSSTSSTKNGKKARKTINSPSGSRSRSNRKQQQVVAVRDTQVTPANDTNSKQGQFSLGDKPKDIVNIRKDVRNQKVEFLISWSNRRNGKIPLPLWVTDQQLKEKAPEILCEFLLKKIKWPKKV